MYAIIRTGGKQYQVAPGDCLRVEKLAGDTGAAAAALAEAEIIAEEIKAGSDTDLGQELTKARTALAD